MPKINIKVTITNHDEKNNFTSPAIITDGLIKYREPNNTLVIFDYAKKTLTRENNDLKMNYIFDKETKTNGILYIKELKNEMPLEIITEKLEIKENNINISFKVEDNYFNYRIEEIK